MVVSDVGKLGILAGVIVGLFVLVLFGKATMEQIDQYLLLILGYVVGNGVNAMRRKAPSSVLVSTVHEDEVLTVAGPYPAERSGGNGEA